MRPITNILTLILLFASLTAAARRTEGVVRSGTTPLAKVVVTDGKSFTQTDSRGRFTLDADEAADYIHIVTPSGYIAPQRDGFPIFYQRADAQIDFDLLPLKSTGTDYALLAVGDPQAGTERHYARMAKEATPDLKATAEQFASQQVAAVGLYLGDMMWDNLQDIATFRQITGRCGVPFYPLIGNHDHDLKGEGDYATAALYRQWFGPTYYGFNLGRDYYIVLDNIIYAGKKVYTEDLTPEQIEWVRGYAKLIPEGANVTLAMHAPVKKYFRKGEEAFMPSLMELIEIFKAHKLSFMTGHSHVQSNFEIKPGVREHMVASIGGAWWLGNSQLCKDGTPAGYQVFVSKAGQRTWYYKSLGKPASHQLRLFDRGAFEQHPGEVTAKIWNYDPSWTIEWSQDGKPMGSMEQFTGHDPEYTSYLEQRRKQGKAEVGGYRKPTESFIFFAAKPTSEARQIEVTATDGFGNRYTEAIWLKEAKQ